MYPKLRSTALVGILTSLAFLLTTPLAQAVLITDFAIYAKRNVIIGVGTKVGDALHSSHVGAGTGAIGIGDGSLNGTAGIYGDLSAGDDVSLANNTFVTGTITNPDGFSVGSGVTFGSHVTAMPTFPVFPAATVYSAGVLNQTVGNGATMNLAPGSYQNVTLGGAATLNLSAGNYYLRRLSAGNGLTINVNLSGGNLNLFLTEDFNANGSVAMNFTSGGDWKNVFAEVHKVGSNAFRIGGNNGTQWRGTVFAPNGDIRFGSGSSGTGRIEGYLWAGRDVDLEHGLDVVIPEPSSFLLCGLGLLGLVGIRRRCRK